MNRWACKKKVKITQGDHSGCVIGCVDIKTVVVFKYKVHILKRNLNGHPVAFTTCPHVVVFYFYTKMMMSKVSKRGWRLLSISINLFFSFSRGTRSGRAAAASRRSPCRRRRRLHTRFVEQCELWDFFCTYYGVMVWDSRCVWAKSRLRSKISKQNKILCGVNTLKTCKLYPDKL